MITTNAPVRTASAGLYLAVLPFYRQHCIAELAALGGNRLRIFAGPRQIDPTVRTGVSEGLYETISTTVIAGRIFVHGGHLREALTLPTLVVDLNPRSITAWFLLLARRLTRRRTLVWGHLFPRAGESSRTAHVRRAMRRAANGTILYGFDSVRPARTELPQQMVWVAPNALYDRAELGCPPVPREGRAAVVYVGRLERAKKVDTLISAFAAATLPGDVRLRIVGDGSEREALERLANDLGVSDRVDFAGAVTDPRQLREIYAGTVVSVSPGYAGLSLTQSLGFGVPMLVSRDEPHAPEIELQRFGGLRYFETGNSLSLAEELERAVAPDSWARRLDRNGLAALVASHYSAQAMAQGLLDAVDGIPQPLGEDGWPG